MSDQPWAPLLSPVWPLPLVSVLCVSLFALLISLAFSGNSLVIAAIFYDRKLRRQPENLFLVSLAVSDLFVSGLVMVLAAANDLLGHWPFGAAFCQFWNCLDISCCTASILNLCAIALDRFVHISRPMRYARFVNRRVICWAVCAIWLLSGFVGTAQIEFGATDGAEAEGPGASAQKPAQCQLQLSPAYAVFSSLLSFFLPATLMIFLYSKLYLYARKHARSIQAQLKQATSLLILQLASDRVRQVVVRPSSGLLPPSARTALHCAVAKRHSDCSAPTVQAPSSATNGLCCNGRESYVCSVAAQRDADAASVDATVKQGTPALSATLRLAGGENNNSAVENPFTPVPSPNTRRHNGNNSASGRSLSSDQKARVTLGVIMGTFLLCWTPFFVVNVWRSLDPQLFPPLLFQAVTWLGYANSSLNPVIYGIFNRDFRRAFSQIVTKLLHCLREERFSPTSSARKFNVNNNIGNNNNNNARTSKGWSRLRFLSERKR